MKKEYIVPTVQFISMQAEERIADQVHCSFDGVWTGNNPGQWGVCGFEGYLDNVKFNGLS